jgi:hypothetical protein
MLTLKEQNPHTATKTPKFKPGNSQNPHELHSLNIIRSGQNILLTVFHGEPITRIYRLAHLDVCMVQM